MRSVGFKGILLSSAVVLAVIFATVFAVPVHASENVIFDDQFTSPTLGPDWSISPGRGNYSLTDNPGYLRYIIDAMHTGRSGEGGYDKSLWLVRTFSGDQWILTAAITYNMRPGWPTNNRNMHFWIRTPGEGWNFKWIATVNRSVGVNDDNPGSNSMSLSAGGNWTTTFFPNSPNPLPLERWYFEIERNKDHVAVRASNDGNDSTFEYEIENTFVPDLGNDQVIEISGDGWYGSNDPAGYADFDFIRVVSTEDVTPPTITDITYTTSPPFRISARITDDVGLMYTGIDVLSDNQCFMCFGLTRTDDTYDATWYGDMYALTDGVVDVDPIYVSMDDVRSFIVVNCLFDEDGDGSKEAVNASARFDPITLKLTGIYSGWWSTVNPLTIIPGTSKITPYNCYFKQIGRTSILPGEPPDYEFSSAGVTYVISDGSEYNLYLRKGSAKPGKYHLNLWAIDTSGNQARYWFELTIPAAPVGGIAFSLDKLALLAPWIILAALITIATVSVAVYWRRIHQGG